MTSRGVRAVFFLAAVFALHGRGARAAPPDLHVPTGGPEEPDEPEPEAPSAPSPSAAPVAPGAAPAAPGSPPSAAMAVPGGEAAASPPNPSGLPEAEYPARDAAQGCGSSGFDASGRPCAPRAVAAASAAVAAGPLDDTARRHDGFFLRLALGVTDYRYSGPTLVTSKVGTGIEILLGGTPWRGVVIGGGVVGVDISGTAEVNSYDAFVQYYPDEHGGFHLQGLVGLALFRGGGSATGPLASAGLGYDGWVGRQLSLGVFGRAGYAHASTSASATVNGSTTIMTADSSVTFGTVEFTFTWH